MGHQGIAINDMCEEDKIEGLHMCDTTNSWHSSLVLGRSY